MKNNVFGSQTLGEVAGECGAESFILISTDKAVRPSSVMGATKRVAELVVQDLGRRFPTRYVAVRFGNVLGSAGSVIPLFREQIARGGPVTITHPDMKRYFMTIPEAAVLTLQAGAMGAGRRDLRARHGRAGAHPGPGEADDRAVGLPAVGGDRHRVHGGAAGGEAVRGAAVLGRVDRQDAAPEDLHREDRGGAGRRSWRRLCRGCGSWLRPARPTTSGRSWARSCPRRS